MKYLAVLMLVVILVGGVFALDTIYPFLPKVANLANDLGQKISDNWRGFLGGNQDSTILSEPSEIETTNNLDLEAKIKLAVDQAVAAKLGELASQAGGSGGLVVVPASQASATPEMIAQYFSDQVEVYPDSSGQSGVIIPVFRDSRGEPYLYIMTPLKK